MRPLLWLLCVIPAIAGAQILPISRFDPFDSYALIRDYLGLTLTQQAAIVANIAVQGRTDAERQRRIWQLRDEIAMETVAANPDAMAIGTREVEIELICRIIDSEATALLEKNVAVLTEAQKAKLKVLEDALKLAATINSAQRLSLLPDSGLAILPAIQTVQGVTIVPTTALRAASNSCAAQPQQR